MGALICNYLPDEASKWNNLDHYAHAGHLRLEQAEVAGSLQEWMENYNSSINFHGFG
jgi:hypothetical protein